MVRTIDFSEQEGVLLNPYGVLKYLLLSFLCLGFSAVGAFFLYDTVYVKAAPFEYKTLVIGFALVIFLVLGFALIGNVLSAMNGGKMIIALAPDGLTVTWPRHKTVSWQDVAGFSIDEVTHKGVKQRFLSINRHGDKKGWVQKWLWHGRITIPEGMLKGGLVPALEILEAAHQRNKR